MSGLYKRAFNYIQPTHLEGDQDKNIQPAKKRCSAGGLWSPCIVLEDMSALQADLTEA